MIKQLLYVSLLTDKGTIAILIIGIALIVGLIALMVWQRKTGVGLRADLEQIAQLQKHNIEFEFVLKAMRLATWHIEPSTMDVTMEHDFRDADKEWTQLTHNVNVSDNLRLLAKEDAERVGKAMEDICQGRTEEYHEIYRVIEPATKRISWEESFAIVTNRDADGKPTGIVGTSMIISERKAMEEALMRARNKAEESDRLKSAFIANMNHEIRTPLNAIIGFTSVLPDIEDSEERRQLIGLIQENNQKLLRIVDDVMNISKIEAGNDQLVMSTFNLCDVLRAVADLYHPNLAAGVTLTTKFATDPVTVTSDLGRIQNVMERLVSNAVKFTQNGSITLGVDEPEAGRLRVWVKDTGKGIPQEFQERIFERFFKIDEFVPGAGMGLSVSRTIAYSLGGTLTVESAPGEGSTFCLELPV